MSLNVWQIDPVSLTPYYDYALCEALGRFGHQVCLITSQFLYDQTIPLPSQVTVDLHYFRGLERSWLLKTPELRKLLRAFAYPLGHLQLLNKLRQHRPDIVHFQWSRLPTLDRWLVEQIKRLEIPVVHTIHDVTPLFASSSAQDPLEQVYRRANALIVHTDANKHSLLSTYRQIDPSRVFVVPIIAMNNTFAPPHADRLMARKALGLSEEAPIILFFGSIRHYKGLDVLAEAFIQAVSIYPDLQLLIVGRPDSEQDIPPSMRDHPQIHLRTDYIPFNEMWKYHLAADAIVFPYRNIYQSGALITAMGYGRSVIVTDVGGLPETIDGNGWVVPTEDPRALASALVEVAKDRQQAVQMGERSLYLIETRHSGNSVAEAHTKIYEQLLKLSKTN